MYSLYITAAPYFNIYHTFVCILPIFKKKKLKISKLKISIKFYGYRAFQLQGRADDAQQAYFLLWPIATYSFKIISKHLDLFFNTL